MKLYKAIINIPIFIDVEASSPEDVKQKVLKSLIASKQIKPGDPVEIKVVEIDA